MLKAEGRLNPIDIGIQMYSIVYMYISICVCILKKDMRTPLLEFNASKASLKTRFKIQLLRAERDEHDFVFFHQILQS